MSKHCVGTRPRTQRKIGNKFDFVEKNDPALIVACGRHKVGNEPKSREGKIRLLSRSNLELLVSQQPESPAQIRDTKRVTGPEGNQPVDKLLISSPKVLE